MFVLYPLVIKEGKVWRSNSNTQITALDRHVSGKNRKLRGESTRKEGNYGRNTSKVISRQCQRTKRTRPKSHLDHDSNQGCPRERSGQLCSSGNSGGGWARTQEVWKVSSDEAAGGPSAAFLRVGLRLLGWVGGEAVSLPTQQVGSSWKHIVTKVLSVPADFFSINKPVFVGEGEWQSEHVLLLKPKQQLTSLLMDILSSVWQLEPSLSLEC